MNIVYQGVWGATATYQVEAEVTNWLIHGEIISDEVAQTIASWWHSPGYPQSTMLSTRGAVTDEMSICDFASGEEYDSVSLDDRHELDALEAYILDKQGNNANNA